MLTISLESVSSRTEETRDHAVRMSRQEAPMFELFALFTVLAVAVGIFVVAAMLIKLTFTIVMVPVKLLFLPLLAVFVIVKFAVILSVGVALAGLAIALIVPVVVVGALVAIPAAIIAAIA
jgi:hypothetical protein